MSRFLHSQEAQGIQLDTLWQSLLDESGGHSPFQQSITRTMQVLQVKPTQYPWVFEHDQGIFLSLFTCEREFKATVEAILQTNLLQSSSCKVFKFSLCNLNGDKIKI
jgi:hypothetical protein